MGYAAGCNFSGNNFPVEPNNARRDISGMWTLAEIATFRLRNQWPESFFDILGPENVNVRCTTTGVMTVTPQTRPTFDNLFGHQFTYQWEKSLDNGASWAPITDTTYIFENNTLTVGARTDGYNIARTQFNGWLDSLRVSKGTARYFGDVMTPYSPLAGNELKDSFTVFGINLGNYATRTVGGTNIEIYTPTISSPTLETLRQTIPEGVSSSWDALWPLKHSSRFTGYAGQAPAIQFVTDSFNFQSYTRYNYLEVNGNALVPPTTIAPENQDMCVEAWFKVKAFRHSSPFSAAYANPQHVLFDSRGVFDQTNNREPTDGVVVFFEPTTSGAHFGRLFVTVAENTKMLQSEVLSAQQWYHVAVVKSVNTWRLYINGVKQAEITSQRAAITVAGLGPSQNFVQYRCKIGYGALRTRYSPSARFITEIPNIVFSDLGFIAGANLINIDTTNSVTHVYTLGAGVYQIYALANITNFSYPVAYQWQTNENPLSSDPALNVWVDLPGATTNNLTSVPITVTENGQGWRLKAFCGDVARFSRTLITNVV